jgi:hypothetical protein
VVVETNIEEARQLLTVVCLDEVDDCQIQKTRLKHRQILERTQIQISFSEISLN